MAQYYFTVQLMVPRPGIRARYAAGGRWLPPKTRSNNVKHPYTFAFRHDGQNTVAIAPPNFPSDAQEHQAYSIYYSDGCFSVVQYDATKHRVGDGVEHDEDDNESSSSSDDDEDDEDRPDWARLGFDRPRVPVDDNPYLSYAGAGLRSTSLLFRRSDQTWAQYYLPDRYQGTPYTGTTRYGGLVGDLALLLGIVAMSVPENGLVQCLPAIVRNPPEGGGWQSPFVEHFPRVSQWRDRKGLVVTVYYRPSETDRDELRDYEMGHYGPIFA